MVSADRRSRHKQSDDSKALSAWTGLRWPLLLLALYMLANEIYQLDFVLADWLYHWEGMRWALRHDFVVSTLLHRRGQAASLVLFIATVGLALASPYWPRFAPWQRGFWYVATSVAVCVVLISLGKHSMDASEWARTTELIDLTSRRRGVVRTMLAAAHAFDDHLL